MDSNTIKRALAKAKGEFSSVLLEEKRKRIISFNARGLERVSLREFTSGHIRVFHKGNWGFATFNTVDAFENYARCAFEGAKLLPAQRKKLALPEPVSCRVSPKIDDPPFNHSIEEIESILKCYRDILKGHSLVQEVFCSYSEAVVNRHFVSNLGSDIEEQRVYVQLVFGVVARDGTNIQRASWSFGGQENFTEILNREDKAEEVVKDAVDLLKAEKVQAGVYTVIVDPKLGGVFIHEAFGHLSEADHFLQLEKLQDVMKIGRRLGTDLLSVVDDPGIPGAFGSYAYDDEGVKGRKTYIIKDGILTGRLHSMETAGILGEELTGNARSMSGDSVPIVRMSSTYIEPRESIFEEMLEGIENGIYAVGAYGGNTELEMFTFSSQKAYKIQNGKIGPMLRDVVLSGNVFETMMNIEMIGNDLRLTPGHCGKSGQTVPVCTGSPHLRIKNVVIGGK